MGSMEAETLYAELDIATKEHMHEIAGKPLSYAEVLGRFMIYSSALERFYHYSSDDFVKAIMAARACDMNGYTVPSARRDN